MTPHDDPPAAVGLLPCPFCGGSPKMHYIDPTTTAEDDPNAGAWYIECERCKCSTNLQWFEKSDQRDLWERWNRRAAAASGPPREPTQAMLEAGFDEGARNPRREWIAMYDAAPPAASARGEPCKHEFEPRCERDRMGDVVDSWGECVHCGAISDCPMPEPAPAATGDELVRRLRERMHTVLLKLRMEAADRIEADAARIAELERKLNTPELLDFIAAVPQEAAHQRERWGTDHDGGKTNADWFWLIGYLAGKALNSCAAGKHDKALHHVITTAAACANWHAAMLGQTNMRPGIEPPAFLAQADAKGSKGAG